MEKYEAILELINSKLKENERMLNHYREENAKLLKENAELKEKIENLTF